MTPNPRRKVTGPRLERDEGALKSYTSENKKAKWEAVFSGCKRNDR